MQTLLEKLNCAVLDDSLAVSCEWLSLECQISISVARRALVRFWKTHEHELDATVYISGLRPNDVQAIVLVPQEQVDDELRRFSRIFGIRLYSIEKKILGGPSEPAIERYFALQKNRVSAQQRALKNASIDDSSLVSIIAGSAVQRQSEIFNRLKSSAFEESTVSTMPPLERRKATEAPKTKASTRSSRDSAKTSKKRKKPVAKNNYFSRKKDNTTGVSTTRKHKEEETEKKLISIDNENLDEENVDEDMAEEDVEMQQRIFEEELEEEQRLASMKLQEEQQQTEHEEREERPDGEETPVKESDEPKGAEESEENQEEPEILKPSKRKQKVTATKTYKSAGGYLMTEEVQEMVEVEVPVVELENNSSGDNVQSSSRKRASNSVKPAAKKPKKKLKQGGIMAFFSKKKTADIP